MNDQGELKKLAIDFVMKQFKFHYGNDMVTNVAKTIYYNNKYHFILLKYDKEHDNYIHAKIKIVYSKPVKRSIVDTVHWEFKGIKHNNFKSNRDIIDSYVLVGIDENKKDISAMWLISSDDDILKRNSYIFIQCEDTKNDNERYIDYRFKII